jgi:hypothetical protein
MVVRERNWATLSGTGEEGENALDVSDERNAATFIIRNLEEFGWLEEAERRVLERVFRLSRAGKAIAAALAAFDQPRTRTRQRNMRSAKSHLLAYLQGKDPDDLLDAYDYARRVTLDLQEDIEHFADLLRQLARDAMENRLSWDQFADVLDNRVATEYAARLVADSAERHRDDIVGYLDEIRGWESGRRADAEIALTSRAPWLVTEKTDGRPLSWILQQTEDAVQSACRTKMPELKASLQAYVGRFTSLLRQVMAMEGSRSSAFGDFCGTLKDATRSRQEAMLDAVADCIALTHLRLFDPQTLKIGSAARRRQASAVSYAPSMTAVARLEAAERAAVAAMFDFTQDDVLEALSAELMKRPAGVLLSELPQNTARQTLYALATVGAAHARGDRFEVQRLAVKADTPTFVSLDYRIWPKA